MRVVMKILRILFLYVIFFVLCVVIASFWLGSWSDGEQILPLFVFGAPIAIVWWFERRRSAERKIRLPKETVSETITPSQGRPLKSTPAAEQRKPAKMEFPPAKLPHYVSLKQEDAAQVRESLEVSPNFITIASEARKASSGLIAIVSEAREVSSELAAIVSETRKISSELLAIASQREEEKTSRKNKKCSQGWIPSNETASIAGRDLGGMIYAGTPPSLNKDGYREKCRAYIDPSLPVAQAGSDRDTMPYWPGYSNISPQCRATYLDWLASGRSDPSCNPGYIFLYRSWSRSP